MIINQPAIEMDFIFVGGKPVIRQDKVIIFARPVAHPLVDLTYKGIEFLIPDLRHVETVMIEHVLNAVEVIENTGEHAFLEAIQQMKKDLFAPLEDQVTQGKELVVADTAIFQPGGILGPAQGKVGTDLLPQIFRKSWRGCVMGKGVQGVNLQRQGVQAHNAIQAGENCPRNGVNTEEHPRLEFDFDNITPLTQAQLKLFVANRQFR